MVGNNSDDEDEPEQVSLEQVQAGLLALGLAADENFRLLRRGLTFLGCVVAGTALLVVLHVRAERREKSLEQCPLPAKKRAGKPPRS